MIDWCKNLYDEEFIESQIDNYDWLDTTWFEISTFQNLSEEFIEFYIGHLDWRSVSNYQKLSESFIEKYADKVDWYYITRFQNLSESFIEKYINKVNFDVLIYSQNLSDEFLKKHSLFRAYIKIVHNFTNLNCVLGRDIIYKNQANYLGIYYTKEELLNKFAGYPQSDIDKIHEVFND